MWSDNESVADYIDYGHLVNSVTAIVNNENLLPCSIGIFGDWGSGKSSLMRMLECQYEGEKGVLVIKFNGWLFEGYEDAKTVLMGRIVDEIISNRKLSAKAIKFASKLLRKIDLMKAAGSLAKYGIGYLTLGPAGLAAASYSDTLSKLKDIDYEKYIKAKQEKNEEGPEASLRNNIQEFHKNFEELIGETEIKKIIVLIDDLDRCSTDTVIGTLEAIKLFLFTKNTAFIIGADERLIKYAVRRRFPEVPGENLEVGRDYLEKLIQFPIRIPPMNSIELTTYINLLFTKLSCEDLVFDRIRSAVIAKKQELGINFIFDQGTYKSFFENTTPELDEAIVLCSQLAPVLSIGLNGNPRQVKRFLNTLLIRLNMGREKGIPMKQKVLAKLMLLEYFKPETFTKFHDIQAINNGSIPIILSLEKYLGLGKENKKEVSSSEEKLLLEDSWLKEWMASEPKIGQENLQPYFYFSRDKLTISAVNLQRMTPKAQEVIQKLLSESQAVQKTGVTAIQSLSSSEAASVFEVLIQKIRQDENSSKWGSTWNGAFEVVREKPDLKSELVTFLEKFPENSLPIAIATHVESLFKDTDNESFKILFNKWSMSQNKHLVTVIKKKLK